MAPTRIDIGRLALAEQLLQQAVYRSREAQAAGQVFGEAGGCGLGERAEVALDLGPRGRELALGLWDAEEPPEEARGAVRELLAEWVRRQDALDRKRNHFLKDFRHRHGFDRGQYSDELNRAYREGLDRVNGEVEEALSDCARRLMQLG